MGMNSIELRDGTEVACNTDREGVFTRRLDGTWSQSVGTSGTPVFRDARHMMRWVRAHLSNSRTDDGSWPAIKPRSGSGRFA